jgi:hypothetical protein
MGGKRGEAALIFDMLIVEAPSYKKSMTLREVTRASLKT